MEYECVCLRCGKIFKSVSENCMFCSNECRRRYSSTDYSGLYWEDNSVKKERYKLTKRLAELKEKGEDYVENQKKETIEKFARIDIEGIMKENGKYYTRTKSNI